MAMLVLLIFVTDGVGLPFKKMKKEQVVKIVEPPLETVQIVKPLFEMGPPLEVGEKMDLIDFNLVGK